MSLNHGYTHSDKEPVITSQKPAKTSQNQQNPAVKRPSDSKRHK